jgi:drug/metabolite transporter (DMT)-like permease
MPYLLLVLMSVLCSVAALFTKKASGTTEIKKLIRNRNLYIGCCLYLIAAFANIFVLRFLDYSTVLPLTSMTYIWTMLLSCFFLKEKINKQKIIGLLGIIIGSVLIVR